MAEASLKLGTDWATKESSLLGYNDENGNYKPIPFDFSRASIGTRVNRDGLIETVQDNIPRIDFSNDGSLLLEPQRTNLVTYSEKLSQWTQTGVSITDNEIISPDGTTNASLITEDSTLGFRYFFLNLTVTTNSHSLSFFAKDNGQYLQVFFGTSDTTGNVYINFDLENGTYDNNGVTNPSIEDFGNGWWKISLQVTPIVTNDFGVLFSPVPSLTSSRLPSYQGDGASGFYIWGIQLEAGSYSTSLIPTSGSAVTRVADACVNAGNASTFNDSEGVLYAEISALANDGTYRQLGITGSGNNQVNLSFDNVANTIGGVVLSSGTYYVLSHIVSDTTVASKVALKYKLNDIKFFINGFEVDSKNSANMPIGLNELNFAIGTTNSNPFYGNCKELRVYNTALTDTELEELTTI